MLTKLLYFSYFFLFFRGIQLNIFGISLVLSDIFSALSLLYILIKKPSLLIPSILPLYFVGFYFFLTLILHGINDIFRVFTVALKYGFFWLLYYSTFSLLRSYKNIIVNSLLNGLKISALLGLTQFVFFFITGVDLLPIDLFGSGDRSAILPSLNWLRVSALNGEPKSLGMHMVIGTLMLMYNPGFVKNPMTWKIFFGFVAILTLSTSAFLLMPIVYIAYLIHQKVNIRSITVVTLLVCSILLNWSRVSNIMDLRVISRLEKNENGLEDFDYIIGQSLLDNPSTIIFGKGIGLSHLNVSKYIKSEWSHYIIDGSKIVAKSGLLHIVAEFGVLGFLMLLLWLYRGRYLETSVSFLYASIVLTLLFILRGTYFFQLYIVMFLVFQYFSLRNVKL